MKMPVELKLERRKGVRPLARCEAGERVIVQSFACTDADAARLRPLGVYEGGQVTVVATHAGAIIDVRGARLALGAALADAIIVDGAER